MSGRVKDLAIIGAGGFAREIANLVKKINMNSPTWNLVGLFGNDEANEVTIEGFPVIGNEEMLIEFNPKPYLVISIANTEKRKQLADKFKSLGFEFATIIDPSARIGEQVNIGEGSVICIDTHFTTNIEIGKHCIINNSCGIGHDTVLGDFISMMSNTIIAGDVFIGDGCYFGLSCTCINLIKLGSWSTYGAGTVITKDMPDNITAVGVPAKIIKYHDK